MFKYTSNYGIALTPAEEGILEKVDNFSYGLLAPHPSLGDLHGSREVELRHHGPDKTRTVVFHRKEVEDLIRQHGAILEDREVNPQRRDMYASQMFRLQGILESMGDGDTCEEELTSRIIAEYTRDEHGNPLIILYMDDIRDYGQNLSTSHPEWVLAMTYVETMHYAWYSEHGAGSPFEEVEIPVTAFGTLHFMEQFDSQEPGILNHVSWWTARRKRGPLAAFGFGKHLFCKFHDRLWREAFLGAGTIAPSPLLELYKRPFELGLCPTDEDRWAEMLWAILHGAVSTGRPKEADDPDKLAVWGDAVVEPPVPVNSKEKEELHLVWESMHLTVQVYKEWLDMGFPFWKVFHHAVHHAFGLCFRPHDCAVNLGGTYNPATREVTGGKWTRWQPCLSHDDFRYNSMTEAMDRTN